MAPLGQQDHHRRAPGRYALKARYLFPVDGPPLADAYLIVGDGRIESIQRQRPNCAVHELGNAAILPGLVNAHTHLEFSDLTAPLGEPGMALPDWIRLVLAYRTSTGPGEGQPERIAQGIAESATHGTTSLGEIATTAWTFSAENLAPLDVVVFREAIGTAVDQADEQLQTARQHVQQADSHSWHPGLSPHAPYTVHPQLLSRLVSYSHEAQVPLAIHLAESREELQWLDSGSGPFRDLLAERGSDPSFRGCDPARPLDLLRAVSGAHRVLIVHGNYLANDEIAYLGARANHMAVVYCPRTHVYFQHDPYPRNQFRRAGVTVALGTDGRGSNPDLSILAEMRFLSRHDPDMPLDRVLQMGTVNGARALGWSRRCGSLTPGKDANLAVVRLPDRAADDPHELVLRADGPIVATIVRGQSIFTAEGPLP